MARKYAMPFGTHFLSLSRIDSQSNLLTFAQQFIGA